MPELYFNRANIALVSEEYRQKTYAEVDYFRRRCWRAINLATKQILTEEVKKAFKDDVSNKILLWNEGIHLLNETSNQSLAYLCLYGPAFCGSWAKIAQNKMMRNCNLEFRPRDLTKKPCPNGFLSRMFSATKGNPVKNVTNVSTNFGKEEIATGQDINDTRSKHTYKILHKIIELDRDPNYLHIQSITAKLNEMEKQGNKTPTIGEVKQLMYN